MRGRPQDPKKAELQKQQLLDSAYQLLADKSFKKITIREIAAKANVSSAMISYHFGSKEQLFMAMLHKLANSNLNQLNEIQSSENPLKTFIFKILDFIKNNQAIARFIHDEVLQENSPLRDKFIETSPNRIATLLQQLLKKMQEEGRIRADLNPKYAGFSLVSLIMMPFIVRPVREKAWGITDQQIVSSEWAEHIYQLFIRGCAGEN